MGTERRKMIKKVLAAALAVALAIPQGAVYAEEGTEGNGYESVSDNSAAEDGFNIQDGVLVNYTGNSEEVVIPEGVASIAEKAFYDKKITKVTIPGSVKQIGERAFEYCSLTVVTMDDGVESIGKEAFYSNESLAEISIPGSVKQIGANAFLNTPWIENRKAENPMVVVNGILIDGTSCKGTVTIPGSIKQIGGGSIFEKYQHS